jgi:hypothetical protein
MKSGNEAISSTVDRLGKKLVHVIVLYGFYHLTHAQ